MKAEINKKHLLTVAWIATTGELKEWAAIKILKEHLCAWDAFDIVQPTDDGGYLTVRKGE